MSVHKLENGKWEVRYREGSRQPGRRFDLKGDADEFDREQRSKRQRGERVIRVKSTPVLDDLAVRLMERRAVEGIAESTLLFNAAVLDKHISPFLGHLRTGEIDAQRLDEWQGQLIAANTTPYMVNRAQELLGQLLSYAKRLGYVEANYAAELPRLEHKPRRGKTASPEQIEAMRDWFLDRDRQGYATLISVLAYVGIRPEEAFNLQWTSLQNRRFLLDAEVTKTKVPRYPEIPTPVLADLAAWKLACGSPIGLIFPRSDGTVWKKTDRDNWRKRWFKPAAEAAELEGFNPYDLRHTCASLMLRAGVPPAEVAAHMGHGLQVLFSTYGHEIEAMRGQPAVSVEQAIVNARNNQERSLRSVS